MGLFGSDSSTTSTTLDTNLNASTNYDPQLGNQGSGSTNLNSANYNPSLNGGTGNSITILSESPGALAAAQAATKEAIDAATQAGQTVADYGNQSEAAARELAASTTATASEQGTKFILVVGALIVIGIGVWFYFKK